LDFPPYLNKPLFKRREGTSYLFRSVFPNDLRELCYFPRELTISLKTGIKTEAIRLASILKIQLDGIFTDIRSGNITETCVTSIKNQLKILLLKTKLSNKPKSLFILHHQRK
jgi:hypothetical protein